MGITIIILSTSSLRIVGLTELDINLLTKLTNNPEICLIASLIFAAGGSHTVFTAGVTKGTLANPIYILAFYTFLKDDESRRRVIVYVLLMTALIATHHLTTLVIFVMLVNTLLASVFLSSKDGYIPIKRGFTLLVIGLTITSVYYAVYAAPGMSGMGIEITLTDWFHLHRSKS
ncbi:MAG: hypothetical protein QW413_06685 [Nitrososphaerota archaeon]